MPRHKGPDRYLFLVSSSYGHLLSAVRLAHLLQKQHKEVLFVTARENQFLLDSAGIQCIPVSNQPHPFLSTYDWYHGEVGLQQYRFILQVLNEFQPETIVTTPLVMPAFALAEIHSLPLIVLGYAEYLFPSPGEEASPKQWRLESITGHYNDLRTLLGLPLLAADSATSPFIGDKHLIRSIPQFTGQQGLPAEVEFIGSFLYEPQYSNYELDRFVANGRSQGRPLFFLQVGRLFEDKELWRSVVSALGKLPVDIVADTARSDYITGHEEFPENFYLHPFIPLGHIKDDVAGVICGGQTTSVISALHYAKPVMGIPISADGAEVVERVVANGVGACIMRQNGVHEESFSLFLDEIGKRRFSDRLDYFQQQLRSYDEDGALYERICL